MRTLAKKEEVSGDPVGPTVDPLFGTGQSGIGEGPTRTSSIERGWCHPQFERLLCNLLAS